MNEKFSCMDDLISFLKTTAEELNVIISSNAKFIHNIIN